MTRAEKKEEAIRRIMSGLDCDRKEAEEIFEYDMKIERGDATLGVLSAEKQKIAAKYTRTGTREVKKPFVPKLEQRERKPNATKGGIIAEVAGFMEENSSFDIKNFQIPSKEGKIAFKIGEKWYTISLTEHRIKPKDYEGE